MCRARNLAFPPSPEIDALDRLTSAFRREAFERLGDAERGYVKWLNRALLEALYPKEIRKAPRMTVRAFLEKKLLPGAEDRQAPRGERHDAH